uniref:Dishevelled-binding antagonist of beta-catenin 1 n=1 Tax=Myripristis murdjan TaxID=586833 RepID=A0A667Y5K5_9TELE
MLLSCREAGGRGEPRDRAPGPAGGDGDAERARTRERLEAALSGLAELELLRQRHELLVRAALHEPPPGRERASPRSPDEKLLEDNILLLRKQLNCLRRRDAGLISQLQELDRQISEMRLDSEASHDQVETDSRPSSGFYELSDGASGSLSNSSNSVFSECFCSAADADGRLPSTGTEYSITLLKYCSTQSSSGTVRRSLSAPHPPSLDPPAASCDSQSKYHCDLVARNGSDVYRYPSPLHAVAVQSPIFFQMLGSGAHGKDDGLPKSGETQSASWPASSSSSQTPAHKRLDGYIYGLLQRRAQPVRTNRPRTSINTDPSKSILRQASLCVRQVSGPGPGPAPGPGTLRGSELKASWLPCGAAGSSSPQRQWSMESRGEEQENGGCQTQNGFPAGNSDALQHGLQADSGDVALSQSDFTVSNANSSPKEIKQPCCPPPPTTDHELPLKSPQNVKTQLATPNKSPRPLSPDQTGKGQDKSVPEGHMVSAKYVPAQRQNVKLRKGGSKNVKIVKVKNTTGGRAPEHTEPMSERRGDRHNHRPGSKKSRLSEEVGTTHHKASKKGHHGNHHHHGGSHHHHHHIGHHHHHGRDPVVVVAKPKYKRNDYRRLRAITEVPYDEAFRRAQRRQRKELLSQANMYLPSAGQFSSPYSYVAGSDSEYSAECASLFHSTIVDTSEDERSNYTTNRFGDSESSLSEEFDGESTTTSDSEESGGGGAGGGMGRGMGQYGATGTGEGPQEMTTAQAKAFVKIKASHNLKKKILRFRSGSLKLMTTV